MAISRIGTATGTNTCTLPTHQAGDLLVIFAFRDGSTTAPSLPAGWWNYFTETGANTCSIRVGYKIATGAGTSVGTWTNATSVIGVVFRGAAGLGSRVSNRASSTTFNFPTLANYKANSTSWIGAFVASRSGNNAAGAPAVETAPSGMSNVTSVKDTTDAAGYHDTNATANSFTSANVSTGVAATGWYTIVFEIIAQDTTIIGYDEAGSSSNTFTDWFVGSSYDCIKTKGVKQFKWYGNANSGTITMDCAIYEETSQNNYTFVAQASSTISVTTTAQWWTFDISANLTQGKRYYLAVWSTSGFTFYFNSPVGRQAQVYATTGNTFNTWPSPESGGITDGTPISLYLVYNVDYSLSLNQGSYTLTGQSVTLTKSTSGYTLPIDQGSYTYTGQSTGLIKGNVIPITQGSYAFTGQSVSLSKGYSLALDNGSYTYAGQSVGLLSNKTISIEQGSYSYTGQPVTLSYGSTIAIDSGSYSYTGFPVGLYKDATISIEQGSYSLSGQSANLYFGKTMPLDSGNYSYSGQDVGLVKNSVMVISQGSYDLNGQDISMYYGKTLAIDNGSYAYTGFPIGLLADKSIQITQGNYTYTGNEIILSKGIVMAIAQGAYAYTGYDVTLSLVTLGRRKVIVIS